MFEFDRLTGEKLEVIERGWFNIPISKRQDPGCLIAEAQRLSDEKQANIQHLEQMIEWILEMEDKSEYEGLGAYEPSAKAADDMIVILRWKDIKSLKNKLEKMKK